MTTLKDLFLEAIEDAEHVRTWPAAVDLHEHTTMLACEFGKRQSLYPVDGRLALMKLRNETLMKVRDVITAAEDQARDAAERAERLDALDRDISEAEREREALDRGRSHSVSGNAFEGLPTNAFALGRESRGYGRGR